jgi:hypothetical protein
LQAKIHFFHSASTQIPKNKILLLIKDAIYTTNCFSI